jgi:putative flippase GtrA
MIKSQFIRFAVVGIISTALNYSLFLLLLSVFSINYLIASAFGYVCGLCLGYPLNRLWTFELVQDSSDKKIKYLLVYLLSLVMGLVLLEFLVVNLLFRPEIANIFVIGFLTLAKFVGIKYLVFKK